MATFSLIFLVTVLLLVVMGGPVFAMIEFLPGGLGKAIGDMIGSIGSFFTGKGCTFKCKNGVKPQPRPGHVASYNGCGSQEFKFDTALIPGLTGCCNEHDICYDTCNSERLLCDSKFKTCLENLCEQNKKILGKYYDDCLEYANVLHAGTVTLGCRSYSDAQKRACLCPRYHSKYQKYKGGEL